MTQARADSAQSHFGSVAGSLLALLAVVTLLVAGCSSTPAAQPTTSPQDSKTNLDRMLRLAAKNHTVNPTPSSEKTNAVGKKASTAASLATTKSDAKKKTKASNQPVSAAQPELDALAAGGGASIARSIFEGVSAGVAGGIEGLPESLLAWGISAMASALFGGPDQQAQIQAELQKIQVQLDALQASVNALSQDVQKASCYGIMSSVNKDITTIDNANTVYRNMIQGADSQKTYAEAVATMKGSNPQGVDFGTLYSNISNIHTALVSGGESGAIAACAKGYLSNWNGLVTGEKSYYTALHNWLSYYYGYQVLGIQLWTQYQTTQLAAANNPQNPQDLLGLCQVSPATPTPTASAPGGVSCSEIIANQQKLYSQMQQEWFAVGAGYSDVTAGKATAIGTASGTTFSPGNQVWLLDLNEFLADDCKKPLTSVVAAGAGPNPTACGGTVGTIGPFPSNDAVLSLTGWRPANAGEWKKVLTSVPKQGQQKVSDALASIGFQSIEDLLIYTGDTVTTSFYNVPAGGGQIPTQALCFLDTGSTQNPIRSAQYCDGYGLPVSSMFPGYCLGGKKASGGICPKKGTGTGHNGWYYNNAGTNYGSFYGGKVGYVGIYNPPSSAAKVGNYEGYNWNGGFLPALNKPMNSYRWPVAPTMTKDTGCGGFSPTNAGGVTSACGSLFPEWLYSTVLPARPGTLAVSWAPPLVAPGNTATGALKVSNLSNSQITGYDIGAVLPPGTAATFESVTPSTSQFSCKISDDKSSFSCPSDDATLEPYTTISLSVKVAVSGDAPLGVLDVVFGANSAQAEMAAVSVQRIQVAQPGVSVLVPETSPLLAPTTAGATGITVANNSTTDSTTTTTVTVGSSNLYTMTMASSPGATCAANSCAIPALKAGASAGVQLSYRPKSAAGVKPGTAVPITFTATTAGKAKTTTITYT
ncbi:MAG: hypothetical protein WCP28_20945, partial [Actinomycetes bacterium]